MATIWIIEDEPTVARVLGEALRLEGHQVAEFDDGLAAWSELSQGPIVDLVLVDLLMSGMTGQELVAAMRSRDSLCHVPILLLTGMDPDEKAFPPEQTYQGVLRKPFDLFDVVEMVSQVLTCSPSA